MVVVNVDCNFADVPSLVTGVHDKGRRDAGGERGGE